MDIRNMISNDSRDPREQSDQPPIQPDLTRSPPSSNLLPSLNAPYDTPPQQTPPQQYQQPFINHARLDQVNQARIDHQSRYDQINQVRMTEPPLDQQPYYSPEQQGRVAQKNQRRSLEKTSKACKTCLYCRKRKTKCNSVRPSCEACSKLGKNCIYPEDSRRLQRPSVKEYQEIKQEYQQMAKQVAEFDGTRPKNLSPRPSSSSDRQDRQPSQSNLPDFATSFSSPYYTGGGELHRTASGGLAGFRPATPYDSWMGNNNDGSLVRRSSAEEQQARARSTSYPPDEPVGPDTRRDTAMDIDDVRYLSHKRSTVSDLASYPRLEPSAMGTPPQKHVPLPESLAHPPLQVESELQTSLQRATTTEERLLANAALLKQKEENILRSDYIRKIDLDGLDPELALHLLDLHWDGPHYNYLLTYRPVIVDCLIRNGPAKYCNKLLLNAIYFSSSVLSDRPAVRQDARLPGHMYYNRFRRLLVDEIDKPTIPTATGLLLVGMTLNASGMTSAGWMLCGIAYRMIGELRCDAAVEGRLRSPASEAQVLALDVDTELRKRLFYAAYLTDAQHSLYYGRPPALTIPKPEICQPYLDKFEESEDYVPYDDPNKGNTFCLYEPRPAFAISTIEAMLRLSRIMTALTSRLYNVDTLRHTSAELVAMKDTTKAELEAWYSSCPEHLLFNPEHDGTPAPHNMTPLLLFHALQVLLHRPFVPSGPFDVHVKASVESGQLDQEASETACVNAAKAIKDIVEAYKAAFTLRTAPFLVMYCTYAAAVGILSTKAKFKSRQVLAFFWTALQDCREGSNRSLAKPASIIRDVTAFCKTNSQETSSRNSMSAVRHERSASEADRAANSDARSASESDISSKLAEQDKMDFIAPNAPAAPSAASSSPTAATSYGPCDPDFWPLHDPLYGLLTPGHG